MKVEAQKSKSTGSAKTYIFDIQNPDIADIYVVMHVFHYLQILSLQNN